MSLFSLELEMFAFGVFLLAVGIINLERLRRITAKEPDLDPAPFDVILLLGAILAIDMYFLWYTVSNYPALTNFGKALFFASLLSIPGVIIAIATWDKKDWKRIFGVVLLFAPFFLLFGWLILSIFNVF